MKHVVDTPLLHVGWQVQLERAIAKVPNNGVRPDEFRDQLMCETFLEGEVLRGKVYKITLFKRRGLPFAIGVACLFDTDSN